jgi:hypothetical protein
VYHPQANVNAHISPHYRGMTDEQCRLIHSGSLEILERTGVLLYYQPAIELLKKAGCYVEENRVRIPAHLVEWALRAAPSHIRLYDRSGKPALSLGDRISNFGTGSDCLNCRPRPLHAITRRPPGPRADAPHRPSARVPLCLHHPTSGNRATARHRNWGESSSSLC